MALRRTAAGKKAKAVFYRQFNDVDIYVEDGSLGSKKLYSLVFGRALASAFRVHSVFPIGPKREVIHRCEADQGAGGRPRVYVVDGDLALLTDKNPVNLRRLLVLKRYCIENYLVDEEAIIHVLNEEDVEQHEEAIREAFAFRYWSEQVTPFLFDLFLLYAAASEVAPQCPTVSVPVRGIVKCESGTLDENKVVQRMALVKQEILASIGQEELQVMLRCFADRARLLGGDKLMFISGKDYLLPLVLMRMRSIGRLRADNLVIKQRLAMKCNVTELVSVKDIVSEY
jgi:hypothetical protein